MILLTSTTDLIEVVTTGTQTINVHADWVDLSGTTVTPGRLNTPIATATTTTVVGSPAVSTQRNVKTLFITNTSASTAENITVEHTDGTTIVVLVGPVSVQPGNTLTWTEGVGWSTTNLLGQLLQNVAQGTAAALAGAWSVKVTDGTNGPAGVTPPSTAATAAQPGLVTSPSPNTAGPVQIISPNELAASLSPATVFPASFLRTTDEPRQLLYDPFDGSTIDSNNWQTGIAVGGGVAPAVASGSLTLGTGTTANGYAYLQSQNNFRLPIPGWMGLSYVILTEFPVTSNTYRFWGEGTVPTVPTASSLAVAGNSLVNGIGWELGTDGKLLAVVWANSTRTVVQDLSAATGNGKQPTDGLNHRYICYIRTDRTYWYVDTLDVPVATSNFQAPSVQTLPDLYLAIAGATPPGASGIITSTGASNWDTSKNNTTISDGTYGWRKATVKASGTQAASTDTSIVVQNSPNAPPQPVGGLSPATGSTLELAVSTTNANNEANVTDARSIERLEEVAITLTQILDVLQNQTQTVQGVTNGIPFPVATSLATSAPLVQSVGTTAGQILAQNMARKEFHVVNTGTSKIYLAFGGVPTTTSYHIPLSACTAANDGTGGSYTSDLWKGSVQAISSAAGGTVVVTEYT